VSGRDQISTGSVPQALSAAGHRWWVAAHPLALVAAGGSVRGQV